MYQQMKTMMGVERRGPSKKKIEPEKEFESGTGILINWSQIFSALNNESVRRVSGLPIKSRKFYHAN